jgi:hypothetical protein
MFLTDYTAEATTGAKACIAEVTSQLVSPGIVSLSAVVTKLYSHVTLNSYRWQGSMIRTNGAGRLKLMYFFNAVQLNGGTRRAKQTGLMFRNDLTISAGQSPIISTVECGSQTSSYSLGPIIGSTLASLIEGSPIIQDDTTYYFLDDLILQAGGSSNFIIVFQDLPQTHLFPAMCPGTGSIPLHLPYHEERIYYINGFHSGTKYFYPLLNP